MTDSKKKRLLPWGHFLNRNPFGLLRASLHTICQNPVILFPTASLAFIQLFILEILYFSPQYPLAYFFGPLIRSVWSEEYLHYPQNLMLLPKIFYYAQIIIYLLIGSMLLALSSKIVAILNEHPKVNIKVAFAETMRLYVHIFCASLISYILFQVFANSYAHLVEIIIKLKPFGKTMSFWDKTLLWTVPYFQFLSGILASTLIVYVIPIIVHEKKKIFSALIENFKILLHTFPTTLLIVGLPTLLYLPILALRNNIPFLMDTLGPEVQIIVIIIGLFVTMGIDLMIIVSATTLYLFVKENS
jgi:hypothetical protein